MLSGTVMATKQLSLKTNIAHLLSIEFFNSGIVTCSDGRVTVVMSRATCERNFDDIIQQIHRAIDECYPERSEDIFILVRDESGNFQNVMKIWKSI
jgi:protein-arginine kinase activator protein McsA